MQITRILTILKYAFHGINYSYNVQAMPLWKATTKWVQGCVSFHGTYQNGHSVSIWHEKKMF